MTSFQIGDQVRVAGLINSQWRGVSGTIVSIIERPAMGESIQECAVKFEDQWRWFLASHLVRNVSDRFVRFFRSEVLERWQSDPDDVATLNGDRDGLVHFLLDQYKFSTRRAEAEVEEFFSMFLQKLERATGEAPVVTDGREPRGLKDAFNSDPQCTRTLVAKSRRAFFL